MAKVFLLRSRLHAAVFLLIVAVPSALLVAGTIRIVAAQMLGESNDLKDVERAVALDPDNPELRYRLGNLYLSATAGNPAHAMASLRKATELNPNNANYWLAVANSCFVGGDALCAAQDFERAIELAPMKPRLQWEAATYYAAAGEQDKTFAHLRRLLELSPDSGYEVFQLAARAFGDPAMVWQKLVAPSRNMAVQCAYLDFLGEKNRFDLTGPYWVEIMAAGGEPPVASGASPANANPQRLTFAQVKSYLQRLMNAQQYEQAMMVWRDLLRSGIVKSPASEDTGKQNAASSNSIALANLLFNGDFTQPILNAGFDWQMRREEYVTLDFADLSGRPDAGNERRSGPCIDFTVPHNAEDEPIYQFVPVTPGRVYVLKANWRSENITSDSGPRLRVVDPQCPPCLDVASDGVTGTTPWHAASVQFTAGATPVVRVSVWRPRSRTFPMDISGRAWMGNVTLRQIR